MSTSTPTLSAPGIVLRPLSLSDTEALHIALSDPDVQLYRRAAVHTAIGETRDYINDTLQRSYCAWAITADGGEAFGRLALRNPELNIGEFGIVLRRTAHRQGYALRALNLAAAYAFEIADFTTLRADIDAENAASIALFRKAGYAHQALERAYRTTKLGVRDSVIMVRRRN